MQNAQFKMQTLNGRPFVLFAVCMLHLALLLVLTGCSSRARAQTLPDGPPLAVPIAPAHEIVIEQIAEAPPPEPEPEPELVVAPSKPNQQKVPTRALPTPRTETPAPASQPAATTPPPAPEAPVVRAAPAAAAGDETKARTLITRATTDLEKRVDYQKLSDEGKAQYNQSKRFRDEAKQALEDRNFLLAVTLADKAATLAAELVR